MIYKIYYREKGIRYVDRLIDLPPVKFDQLPSSALFHYVPMEAGHPEIEPSLPYFQGYTKKIFFDYVTEYTKMEGGVRKPMFNLNELTRAWRRDNIQKWQLGEEAWRKDHNPETLHVINYGYLDEVHKYLTLQLAEYHRWLNRQRTVWDKVAEIAKVSDRHQFLFVPIPAMLQGRTILDKYAQEEISIKAVQIFGSHGWAGFMQLDLWRWLNIDTRSKSLLSAVDPKDYSKVNLVFQGTSGNQAIVNLGYLNSWIKGQPNMTEFGNIVQFDPVYMQKMFLKMAMTLNAVLQEETPETEAIVSPVSVPTPVVKKEPSDPDVKESPDDLLFDDAKDTELERDELESGEDLESGSSQGPVNIHTGVSQRTQAKTQDLDPDRLDDIHRPEFAKALMDDLEKDMEALDRLSLKQLQVSGIKLTATSNEDAEDAIDPEVVKRQVFGYAPPESILQKRLDEDAEANLLTAADYRKLKESVSQYQSSEDPYGSSKLRLEAMKIVPEDIALKSEDIAIETSDAVPDKTMAQSSLKEFDKQYLKKVYKKDVLQVVNAVQAAGVVVRRHEIDVTHSALGSYEQHTLELKPVDGAPSVIQFTFPKVDEDGTFTASSNKYRLRTQRVD